jgi:general stress protein YciG
MAKGKRGFASMAPDKLREIARKGGQTAHVKGTAHEYTPQEARIAGRKGGKKVSQDRAYMAAIGSKGGVKRQMKGKESS